MMCCRLGNQLFRYAFARALQIKFYPDYVLELNVYPFKCATEQQKKIGYDDALKDFQIADVVYSETKERHLKTFFQLCLSFGRNHILGKIFPHSFLKYIDTKILQRIFNLFGLYAPMSVSEYVKPRYSFSKNIICSSNFENARYFDDIRDILLEEFQPKYDILPHNIDLMNEIKSSESVCVHVRRGDFLSEENSSRFYVCNEEYFITAMKKIRDEIPNCKFFIFSDDADDVKKSFHFPFEVTYEPRTNPPYESLRLMYNCKHFIISNSTFSWWAQYLSRNENKIVYAPVPWRWNEDCSGMYFPYMRTIECKK